MQDMHIVWTYSMGLCKGNCGPKKHSKHHAHSRALKSTSRGSEDVQLHNNELEYITYLVGDPKRKEWGSPCWHSLTYKPTYEVPSNVNWMSIYVKHISNTNKITRLIKGIRENRRKGLGMSLGLRVRRLWVWGSEGSKTLNIMWHHKTDEVSWTQRFKGFENSSVASWGVSPYNHPPFRKALTQCR